MKVFNIKFHITSSNSSRAETSGQTYWTDERTNMAKGIGAFRNYEQKLIFFLRCEVMQFGRNLQQLSLNQLPPVSM